MAVVNLIEEDIIKIPLEAKTKPDVIKELVDVLKKAGKIEDAESVFRAVMLRENMGSTGLEKGIAVPHAKTHKVNNLVLAIGVAHFHAILQHLRELEVALIQRTPLYLPQFLHHIGQRVGRHSRVQAVQGIKHILFEQRLPIVSVHVWAIRIAVTQFLKQCYQRLLVYVF